MSEREKGVSLRRKKVRNNIETGELAVKKGKKGGGKKRSVCGQEWRGPS